LDEVVRLTIQGLFGEVIGTDLCVSGATEIVSKEVVEGLIGREMMASSVIAANLEQTSENIIDNLI
jgi:hypothetical protein